MAAVGLWRCQRQLQRQGGNETADDSYESDSGHGAGGADTSDANHDTDSSNSSSAASEEMLD
jgi:hypothetical protein